MSSVDEELKLMKSSICELTITQNDVVNIVQNLIKDFECISYDIDCKCNNLKYELLDPRAKDIDIFLPIIKNQEETIDKIINEKCSFARFGDGEFSIMFHKKRQNFQHYDSKLANRLKEVIQFDDDNCLIGIADNYGNLEKYNSESARGIRIYMTEETRDLHRRVLKKDKVYYDAYSTRPYVLYRDNMTDAPKKRFEHLKKIWEKRHIVTVEGAQTRLGLQNDLFDNAVDMKRIIAPATNSFDRYDDLLECALKNAHKDTLFIVAIGPSSGVLVYDLYKKGYQAVDVGHIDLEYEWFKAGTGKRIPVATRYNNEIKGDEHAIEIHDEKYENEIIAKFL